MALYRVKQFMWGITASFKKVDEALLNKYLNSEEKDLFNKLNHKDKIHSVRVCIDALNSLKDRGTEINKNRVAKAALLHDIGKAELALGVIEKSALVMLNKITKGKLRKYKHIKRVDIYYNHGEKGVKLLKRINKGDIYDEEFLHCIENHHENTIKSELVDIIKESDDKN